MFRSPGQYVVTVLASGALVISCMLLAGERYSHHTSLFVMYALVILMGVLAMYWTGIRLKQEVENQRWSEDQVAPFRQVVRSAQWKLLIAGCILLMVVAFIFFRHRFGYMWSCIVFTNMLNLIGGAFYRPNPVATTQVVRSPSAPLYSAKWGDPGQASL